MRKVFFTLLIIFTVVQAKSQSIAEKDFFINGNVGLVPVFYSSSNWKTIVPPSTLSIEYGLATTGIRSVIGLGLAFTYGYSKTEYQLPTVQGLSGNNYQYIVAGAQFKYHYYTRKKNDFYIGALVGKFFSTAKQYGAPVGIGEDDKLDSWAWDFHAGWRYFLGDNFALNGELGYGLTAVKLGISYRFLRGTGTQTKPVTRKK